MNEASDKYPVLHIALWEPEIPPNTGNVARLCAATGAELHLIGRLGFRLDDRRLRAPGSSTGRSSSFTTTSTWPLSSSPSRAPGYSPSAVHSQRLYTAVKYEHGDCLLFGSESHGLPASFLDRMGTNALRLPMPSDTVRSLNLATAAGIAAYEALRQIHGW